MALPRVFLEPFNRPSSQCSIMTHHDPEVEKIMKEIPNEISTSELEYGAKIGQGQYGTYSL